MIAILWREFRLHYTKIFWLISNFVPPLFYLFFFGTILAKSFTGIAIEGNSVSYLRFFIPGLLIMQSFFVMSHTLATVNLDRRTNIIELVKMTATNFDEYVVGRFLSVQVLVVIKVLLLAIIGFIFLGLAVPGFSLIIVILPVFLISNCVWFCVGFIFGLVIKTEDVRDITLQLLTLPITFLSNIYYPTGSTHGLLGLVIAINPLTHATNLIRPAFLGLRGFAWWSFFYLAACAACSVAAAVLVCRMWQGQRSEGNLV